MTIQELDDKKFGFTKVSPIQLLAHLRDRADAVNAIEINVKLQERDKAINFEGEVTLKTFFALVDNEIK